MSRLFSGTLNYKNGLRMTHFWDCFGNSLFITVGSVVLIVLCCSMCAWYIVRVKTKGTKLMYTLCLFSMIVPFQMVMFTLSKFANMLQFIKSTRYHHRLPGLWSRTCCVYVYRICKEYLIRD